MALYESHFRHTIGLRLTYLTRFQRIYSCIFMYMYYIYAHLYNHVGLGECRRFLLSGKFERNFRWVSLCTYMFSALLLLPRTDKFFMRFPHFYVGERLEMGQLCVKTAPDDIVWVAISWDEYLEHWYTYTWYVSRSWRILQCHLWLFFVRNHIFKNGIHLMYPLCDFKLNIWFLRKKK